jgi:hypothetical protein
MAFDPTPEQRQAFAEALYAGRKIAAIKQLRDWSGLGLKESKDIIDHLETELRAAHPERFTAPKKSGGCLVIAILLFPVAVVLWFLWRRFSISFSISQ